VTLSSILSLVPFVSFIVLAGNAIATSSSADLTLLSAVVSVLGPPAPNSPIIQKIHDACERFSRIAHLVVSNSSEAPLNCRKAQGILGNGDLLSNQSPDARGVINSEHLSSTDHGFPMAQQDWDNFMIGFEAELENYDPRSLTNIIEPYMTQGGW
jgi:hypothetical protein